MGMKQQCLFALFLFASLAAACSINRQISLNNTYVEECRISSFHGISFTVESLTSENFVLMFMTEESKNNYLDDKPDFECIETLDCPHRLPTHTRHEGFFYFQDDFFHDKFYLVMRSTGPRPIPVRIRVEEVPYVAGDWHRADTELFLSKATTEHPLCPIARTFDTDYVIAQWQWRVLFQPLRPGVQRPPMSGRMEIPTGQVKPIAYVASSPTETFVRSRCDVSIVRPAPDTRNQTLMRLVCTVEQDKPCLMYLRRREKIDPARPTIAGSWYYRALPNDTRTQEGKPNHGACSSGMASAYTVLHYPGQAGVVAYPLTTALFPPSTHYDATMVGIVSGRKIALDLPSARHSGRFLGCTLGTDRRTLDCTCYDGTRHRFEKHLAPKPYAAPHTFERTSCKCTRNNTELAQCREEFAPRYLAGYPDSDHVILQPGLEASTQCTLVGTLSGDGIAVIECPRAKRYTCRMRVHDSVAPILLDLGCELEFSSLPTRCTLQYRQAEAPLEGPEHFPYHVHGLHRLTPTVSVSTDPQFRSLCLDAARREYRVEPNTHMEPESAVATAIAYPPRGTTQLLSGHIGPHSKTLQYDHQQLWWDAPPSMRAPFSAGHLNAFGSFFSTDHHTLDFSFAFDGTDDRRCRYQYEKVHGPIPSIAGRWRVTNGSQVYPFVGVDHYLIQDANRVLLVPLDTGRLKGAGSISPTRRVYLDFDPAAVLHSHLRPALPLHHCSGFAAMERAEPSLKLQCDDSPEGSFDGLVFEKLPSPRALPRLAGFWMRRTTGGLLPHSLAVIQFNERLTLVPSSLLTQTPYYSGLLADIHVHPTALANEIAIAASGVACAGDYFVEAETFDEWEKPGTAHLICHANTSLRYNGEAEAPADPLVANQTDVFDKAPPSAVFSLGGSWTFRQCEYCSNEACGSVMAPRLTFLQERESLVVVPGASLVDPSHLQSALAHGILVQTPAITDPFRFVFVLGSNDVGEALPTTCIGSLRLNEDNVTDSFVLDCTRRMKAVCRAIYERDEVETEHAPQGIWRFDETPRVDSCSDWPLFKGMSALTTAVARSSASEFVLVPEHAGAHCDAIQGVVSATPPRAPTSFLFQCAGAEPRVTDPTEQAVCTGRRAADGHFAFSCQHPSGQQCSGRFLQQAAPELPEGLAKALADSREETEESGPRGPIWMRPGKSSAWCSQHSWGEIADTWMVVMNRTQSTTQFTVRFVDPVTRKLRESNGFSVHGAVHGNASAPSQAIVSLLIVDTRRESKLVCRGSADMERSSVVALECREHASTDACTMMLDLHPNMHPGAVHPALVLVIVIVITLVIIGAVLLFVFLYRRRKQMTEPSPTDLGYALAGSS